MPSLEEVEWLDVEWWQIFHEEWTGENQNCHQCARCIIDCWDVLPTHIITHAFKGCGISNEMDGSGDDILCEEKVSSEKSMVSSEEDEEEEEAYDSDLRYANTRFPVKEEEYLNLWDSDSEDEF